MLKVFFIGSGRLAKNLAYAFSKTDMQLAGVCSRNEQHGKQFSELFSIPLYLDLSMIPSDCDLYVLAVSDQAISEVSDIIQVNGIVVHCSGMMPLDLLSKHENAGVFWPIQSFSHDSFLDFSEVPVCIQSNNDSNNRILEVVSDKISRKTLFVSEEQRNKLHLAAVLVNNFSNHLFHLAAQFLDKNNLQFSSLMPLIEGTVAKLHNMSPAQAQTGPASRNDQSTLEKHRALLSHDPDLLRLYNQFTQSILQSNN